MMVEFVEAEMEGVLNRFVYSEFWRAVKMAGSVLLGVVGGEGKFLRLVLIATFTDYILMMCVGVCLSISDLIISHLYSFSPFILLTSKPPPLDLFHLRAPYLSYNRFRYQRLLLPSALSMRHILFTTNHLHGLTIIVITNITAFI